MSYEKTITEYQAEIAALDRKIAELKSSLLDWKRGIRGDLFLQLKAAKAASRARPPDGGGS